jgi:hypothetical protein
LRENASRIILSKLHDPKLAAYMTDTYTHGFEDTCDIPIGSERYYVKNKILPSSPLAEPWHDMLSTMRENGRLLSMPAPRIPGTIANPISTEPQMKYTFKIKLRPTIDGNSPRRNNASIGAHCHPANRQSTTSVLLDVIATIVKVKAVAFFAVDYEGYYNTLPRRREQVGRNCIFFHLRGDDFAQFHYGLDNVYGSVTAPHAGELHATVLNLLQTERMSEYTGLDIDSHRRVDDTLFFFPIGSTLQQRNQIRDAFHDVCASASQPTSDHKEVFNKSTVVFDGFTHILDFCGKHNGGHMHPGAVGICNKRQLKLAVQVTKCINGATRKEAESMSGLVEWVATAIPHLPSTIAEYRKQWVPLEHDNSKVAAGPARPHLLTLLDLLAFPMFTPYRVLLCLEKPTAELTTDASGKDGIGGYLGLPEFFGELGCKTYFYEPLRQQQKVTGKTRKDDETCMQFLELLGLFYILSATKQQLRNQSVRWWTDSLSAVNCWQKQSSKDFHTNSLLVALSSLTIRNGIHVQAVHIHRELSRSADALTHNSLALFANLQAVSESDLVKLKVPQRAVTRALSLQSPLEQPKSHSKASRTSPAASQSL